MMNQICERPEVDELLDLGMVLGQNQAFGFLAGRCSAVQAELIRRIRTEKLYKRVCEHWREFCPKYLKMSGSQADSIIRLWEEFGPGYFEIAQLTRVSPETYRALQPAVENGVLHLKGEHIELTVENSRKVAAAVAAIRRAMPPKKTVSLPEADRLARLDQLWSTVIEELDEIPRAEARNYDRFRDIVLRMQSTLDELHKLFGM